MKARVMIGTSTQENTAEVEAPPILQLQPHLKRKPKSMPVWMIWTVFLFCFSAYASDMSMSALVKSPILSCTPLQAENLKNGAVMPYILSAEFLSDRSTCESDLEQLSQMADWGKIKLNEAELFDSLHETHTLTVYGLSVATAALGVRALSPATSILHWLHQTRSLIIEGEQLRDKLKILRHFIQHSDTIRTEHWSIQPESIPAREVDRQLQRLQKILDQVELEDAKSQGRRIPLSSSSLSTSRSRYGSGKLLEYTTERITDLIRDAEFYLERSERRISDRMVHLRTWVHNSNFWPRFKSRIIPAAGSFFSMSVLALLDPMLLKYFARSHGLRLYDRPAFSDLERINPHTFCQALVQATEEEKEAFIDSLKELLACVSPAYPPTTTDDQTQTMTFDPFPTRQGRSFNRWESDQEQH